jgi:MFS transporter, FSR family, fosmidomycin resistance protein
VTQAAETAPAGIASDTQLVAGVSAAHFVSHYYIIILPPLFGFVRADYGVSYIELGLALTAFNVVTALGQTPAGYLVDRFGPRVLLISGLLLGALAFALAGLVNSFWFFVAMFGLAGLANTVYHPADYAMLSHHVAPERISRAFSIHTFAGMLGSTAAPVSLLLMQSQWGWRGAFIGSALLGIVVAIVLLVSSGPEQRVAAKPKSEESGPVGWRLLVSAPILLNLVLFALFALVSGGLQYYSVVALGVLYGTAPAVANTALTGYLLFSALGVLAGGVLGGRTGRYNLIVGIGFGVVGACAAVLASMPVGDVLIVATMATAGFFMGVTMPSRDLIVRAVTPAGSFGKVFGFVTSGFNLGGIIAPLIFGYAMDHGAPQWVFWLVVGFSLLYASASAFSGGRVEIQRAGR